MQCRRPKFSPRVRKIPWRREWLSTPAFLPREFQTEEPGGLQSMESQRVRQDWVINTFIFKVIYESESESEVAQSCLTLCDILDCSLSGSSIHGIFQARVLQWIAISFSRGSSRTQELNPGLQYCRQMLYHLSHLCISFIMNLPFSVWIMIIIFLFLVILTRILSNITSQRWSVLLIIFCFYFELHSDLYYYFLLSFFVWISVVLVDWV